MILIKCKFSSVKLVNTFILKIMLSFMNKTKRRRRDYFHKAVLKFIFHLTPPCLFHNYNPLQRSNIESAFVVFHTFLSM